jgi:hypothetical protein
MSSADTKQRIFDDVVVFALPILKACPDAVVVPVISMLDRARADRQLAALVDEGVDRQAMLLAQRYTHTHEQTHTHKTLT